LRRVSGTLRRDIPVIAERHKLDDGLDLLQQGGSPALAVTGADGKGHGSYENKEDGSKVTYTATKQ
jgi:nitrogen regulatory protein PII